MIKVWSVEEDIFLRENANQGVNWLVNNLGRSKDSIAHRAMRLGVSLRSKLLVPFTKEQRQFITDSYNILTWKQMSEFLVRPVTTIRKEATKLGLDEDRTHFSEKERTKYIVNKGYFSELGLENCYWAGFIAADGCLREDGNRKRLRITLQRRDHNHLVRFTSDVGYTGPVIKRIGGGFKGSGRSFNSDLNITGVSTWHRDLKKNFNITPNKTLTLDGPNIKEFDMCCAYVKGIIDGDGSIFNEGRNLVFSITGTHNLLSFIKNLLDSEFESYHSSKKVAQVLDSSYGNYSTYKVKGRRAEKILCYLKNLDTPYLERKWSKVKEVLSEIK